MFELNSMIGTNVILPKHASVVTPRNVQGMSSSKFSLLKNPYQCNF